MKCCTATTTLLAGFMLMAAALSHSSAAALDLQQGGSSQKIVVRGRAWDASPSSNVKFDGLLLREWWHWQKSMTSASTTTVAAAAMDRGEQKHADVKLEGRALQAAGGGVQEEPDYAGDYTPSHNVDTGSSPLPSPVKVINGRRLLQDYAPMANANGSPSVGRKLM